MLQCSAIDFIFKFFNSTTNLLLYGNAITQFQHNTPILSLTNSYPDQIGRALYQHKIPMKNNASSLIPFSTSFIFAMSPARNRFPGHGFVFLFSPVTGIPERSRAQYAVLC
ncbi:hypothetical protein QVD17_32198 [Tagetes erecta]|uniref:Legume lectin domain-containing protein n=1 Tax=Tagetes erecta TaxID=13708 RepID=A0AAD8K573_TARER|nr:hypothetical protein QVD17_32198 [Tagetes erecta]